MNSLCFKDNKINLAEMSSDIRTEPLHMHHSKLSPGLWKEVQSENANNTASQAWLVEETSLLPVHLSIKGLRMAEMKQAWQVKRHRVEHKTRIGDILV